MITSTHYRMLPEFHETQLPIRLHERSVADRAVRGMLTVMSVAVLMVVPAVIVCGLFVLGQADFSTITTTMYAGGVAILLVLLLPSLTLGSAAARKVRQLSRRRVVTINESQVIVREESLFGSSEWWEPLSRFKGVKSVGTRGGRQKLLLAHPDSEKEVVVWIGQQIPEALVAGYEALLGRSGYLCRSVR